MRIASAVLAIALCQALAGLAAEELQGPPPAPVIVGQFLGFSDAQASQFQKLLESLQSAIGGLEQQMMSRQQRLDTLLGAETPDPAAAGALLLEIRALQKQAGRAFDAYHEAFLALLTAEQKQKVQAVAQAAQLLPAVRAFAEVRLIEPPR